ALATGAIAHISKDVDPQEMMRVIRTAAGLELPNDAALLQRNLGELLIAEKALTARQLQDLDRARDAKQTLSNAILRSGMVVPETLARALPPRGEPPGVSVR